MRVLIVALEDPWQPLGGAALRTRGWSMTACKLESVSQLRVLSLLASGESGPRVTAVPGLERRRASIERSSTDRVLGRMLAAARGLPRHLGVSASRRAQRAVLEAIDDFEPDVVQLEQLAVARLALAVRRRAAANAKILFSSHNLEHRIVRRATGSHLLALERYHRRRVFLLEESLLAGVDGIVAVSAAEASWFRARTDKPVFEVPNAVDLGETGSSVQTPDYDRGDVILFCGHLGYPPNVEAADYLVNRVMPNVWRDIPSARVLLAGRSPGRRLRSLAGPAVEVVADPTNNDFFYRSRVLVCPLRHGAGSRIKLLEAAATGVPIVATPFSAEGLSLVKGKDYLQGRDEQELSRATVRLLREETLRRQLIESARATVERDHSWQGLAASIGSVYETLAGGNGEKRGR